MDDIVGEKFNRWTVKSVAYKRNGQWLYNCVCDCSPELKKLVRRVNLLSGDSQSCGCLQRELSRKANSGKSRNSKIKRSEYEKIIKLKGKKLAKELAQEYGVSVPLIFKIWQSKKRRKK